ncbi:hypothetical protein O6H91_01G160000 [Diphasiastrum complanatum]|uniref:Uncharacterized protein n=1 Tax=Diphasiastrum complanatum TaxID=34168 RepID=A0ACC2EY31_DIPCM|nr:hypothetical protein O6H91_01G160000 [Diphasiastrum complanatum]
MTQENCNEETDCQASEAPLLCSNNCGHHGSVATKNMCSKCYEDVLKHTEVPVNGLLEVSAVDSATELIVKPSHAEPYSEVAAPSLPSPRPSTDLTVSLHKTNCSRTWNRCFSCNRRVGLTGFRCRCGDIFCALHRYSDRHECSFDYRAAGRDAISKANPLIRAAKIQKI